VIGLSMEISSELKMNHEMSSKFSGLTLYPITMPFILSNNGTEKSCHIDLKIGS